MKMTHQILAPVLAVTVVVGTASSADDPITGLEEAMVHVDAAAKAWDKITGTPFPDGLERKRLHANKATGGGAGILKFPEGYIEPRHYHTTAGHSVYILKGSLKIGGETYGPGNFFYAPKNVAHGPNEALEETEILIWSDGPLDLHMGDLPPTGDGQ
ncbi:MULTISPECIES: cupin domain-containing protein [Kordiimonas]|jgi:quercetin dioxygenase-like cupin family protein|uniref:cupin domain-containing protein n=1 Tax=Kordiimonas TaxID=288021 RepID=UPI00257A5C63|nr:DUF4437 domain-containing protein [Kordiimonas sp. UBA4487]